MSDHNTTDAWASMIINELFDEADALGKTSKVENVNDKQVNSYKSFDTLDQKINLCETEDDDGLDYYYKDNSNDFDHSYKDKLENQNTCNSTFQKLYKTQSDIVRNQYNVKDFANVQKLITDHSLKSNTELIKRTANYVTNFTEKTIDSEKKIDDVCMTEQRENLKNDVMLIDLNEAFIHEDEKDSRNTQEYEKNIELLHLTENMNENSKDLPQKTTCSFSSDVLHSEYDEKKSEYFCTVGDDMSKSAFRPYPNHQNLTFLEKFGANKMKLHTNNMSFVDANSGTGSRILQKYCNRKDQESERIECGNLQKKNSTNGKWCEEEDYVIVKMVSHLKASDELSRNTNSVGNYSETVPEKNSKSFTDRNNSTENTNILITGESGENGDLKNETVFDENIVDGLKNVNTSGMNSKQKCEYENMNEKLIETNYSSHIEINKERNLGIERYFNGFGGLETFKHDMPRTIVKRDITADHISREKLREDKTLSNFNKTDGEEISIRNQRANFVITKYRAMCLSFEIVLVRPFANVLADSYEFISFIFFLLVCVFYLFFDRIQYLISDYKIFNQKKSPDGSDVKEKMRINGEEPIRSTAVSSTNFLCENEQFKNDKLVVAKITFERSKNIEKCLDINSWIKVSPEEIEIIALNYEIATEKVMNLYEKAEIAFTDFRCGEQYRASVNTSADILVNFEYINANKNDKMRLSGYDIDFEEEVIASSKRTVWDRNEIGEQSVDDSCIIVKFLKENLKSTPLTNRNSDRASTNIFPEDSHADVKPLFNSVEVDAFKMDTNYKFKISSSSDVSSTSNIPNTEGKSFKMQTTSRMSPERRYLTSSMTVNLSSFSSRTDILSESAQSIETSRFCEDEEPSEYLLPPRSLNFSAAEDSLNVSTSVTKSNLTKEVSEKCVESNFEEQSCNARKNSGIFSVLDSVDASFQQNSCSKQSLMIGDTKFTPAISNPNSKTNSFIKNDTFSLEVKENLKKRNSLRHRMCSILDSWKNIHVMPSCVAKNSQHQKKSYSNDSNKK